MKSNQLYSNPVFEAECTFVYFLCILEYPTHIIALVQTLWIFGYMLIFQFCYLTAIWLL